MRRLRLSVFDKIQIIKNYDFKSLGKISEEIHRSRSSIITFYLRWLSRKTIENKKSTGRPRYFQARRLLVLKKHIRRNPFNALHRTREKLKFNCCLPTMAKAHHQLGFDQYNVIKYLNYSPGMKPNELLG